tara:strand:- start:419 stop:1471 length:1053 start_codon:yes stop_codon:yes gene_type:complete
MTTSIHLFLSDNHHASPESLTDQANLRFRSLNHKSLECLRRDELVSFFDETTSEYVGFVDRHLLADTTQLNQLHTLELSAEQPEVCLLPFGDSKPLIQSYECLPPLAASLAMNPFQHAVVLIPRSAFLSLEELPDSGELLWQTVILLAQAGMKSQLIDSIPLTRTTNSKQQFPALAPQYPGLDRDWLLRTLRAYQPDQDLSSISSPPDATALKAGLFCIHDYLEESHQFSQSVEHQGRHHAGDYWHHIMHRREPDYSNAKYWSRAVGYHPLHDILPAAVQPLFDLSQSQSVLNWKNRFLQTNRWSLNAFVDCCEECETSQDPELNEWARKIQWMEMQLLLQKTSLDAATG